MHLDGMGNVIHGRPLHVTVLTPFSLGSGVVALPGMVVLMEEGTAHARIHSKAARESTPEEIALFVAEKERDRAAIESARSHENEASRLAAEQAAEAEIESRVAERIGLLKEQLAPLVTVAANKKAFDEIFENAAGQESHDEDKPANLSGGITHGDPAVTHRDP